MEHQKYGDYGDKPELTILFWVLVSVFGGPVLAWLIVNDVFAIF